MCKKDVPTLSALVRVEFYRGTPRGVEMMTRAGRWEGRHPNTFPESLIAVCHIVQQQSEKARGWEPSRGLSCPDFVSCGLTWFRFALLGLTLSWFTIFVDLHKTAGARTHDPGSLDPDTWIKAHGACIPDPGSGEDP